MTDDESTRLIESRKNRQEIFACKGNASCSRRKISRCKVHEDGTAGAGNRWIVIESDDDHEVIEMVTAPHDLVPSGKGQGYRPVVVVVPGIVAPPVPRRDGRYRKRTLRPRLPVGPEEHPLERPHAGRGSTVTLHLSVDDAGNAKRTATLVVADTRAPLAVHHDISHAGNVPVAAP